MCAITYLNLWEEEHSCTAAVMGVFYFKTSCSELLHTGAPTAMLVIRVDYILGGIMHFANQIKQPYVCLRIWILFSVLYLVIFQTSVNNIQTILWPYIRGFVS